MSTIVAPVPATDAVLDPLGPLGPSQLFSLDGSVGIVVGGYGGIGAVVTELLARSGASVTVAGRNLARAEQLALTLRDRNLAVAAAEVDVTDQRSVEATVGAVAERSGGLDFLVNLAAVDSQQPSADVDADTWRAVVDTNLTGAFWLSQAAARLMREVGGGRIVHLSSTRAAFGARRGFAAYSAAKAGVNQLIRQLATEWAEDNIAVNGIAPGFVPTPLVSSRAAEGGFVEMMRQRVPLGRFGTALEMAGPVAFLLTPAARFITGQILYVDGGVTASS